MLSICSELLGPGPKTHQASRHGKLFHLFIILLAITFTLLFRYKFADLAQSDSEFAQRLASDTIKIFEQCQTTECFAQQAAYRIVNGTLIYLIVLFMMSALWPEFHFGFLIPKFLFWISSLVMSFLIPISISSYVISWSNIIISILDLIASLELISFACNIQDMLRNRPSISRLMGILLTAGNIFALVYYIQSMFRSPCSSIHIIIIIIQLCIHISALITTRFIGQHSFVLTTSIVMFYTTFTLYRSVIFQTQSCSFVGIQSDYIEYMGIALSFIVIIYRSISTRPISIFGATSSPDLYDVVETTLPTVIDAKSAPLNEPVRISSRWSSSLFYLFLGLALLYTSRATDQDKSEIVPSSNTSFILSIMTSFLTSTLYLWTLIAPRLFPNRDFGVRIQS